jgi:dimeric dUTPase (all-alpha-NTP-PPase superfamily)
VDARLRLLGNYLVVYSRHLVELRRKDGRAKHNRIKGNVMPEMKLKKLAEMLEMQDGINKKVHPEWRSQGFIWPRAIWTECAELMDHIGWKWWKKQEFDRAQAMMELVDIWHFILSWAAEDEDRLQALKRLVAINPKHGCVGLDYLRCSVERMASSALSCSFNAAVIYFFQAANIDEVNLDFDDLYRLYIGKNALNFFRQDHGYQNGGYRKSWPDGREDNAHLVEVIAECANSDDFAADVYAALQVRYAA